MTAIYVTIWILLILVVVAAAKLAGFILDNRRLPHWTDDDIAPPPWVNDGRPHHGRCRRGAWHDRNHQ